MKCQSCGYDNAADALTCNLCSELLQPQIADAGDATPANPWPALKGTKMRATQVMDTAKYKELDETDALDAHTAGLPKMAPIPPATGAAAGSAEDQDTGPNTGPRLVCPPFPTVGLVEGEAAVIGRLDGNALVLSSNLISRRHAQATFEDGKWKIADLGSANGTFLNGVPLPAKRPQPLGNGDSISVGPFTIRFLDGAEIDEPTVVESESDTRTTFLQPISIEAGLSGRLSELSMPELMQSIALYRKSGTLRLRIGMDEARVVIENGAPYSARFAGLAGVEALRRILVLLDGSFTFEKPEDDFPGGSREINTPLTRLLLDAQREIDERQASGLPKSQPSGGD